MPEVLSLKSGTPLALVQQEGQTLGEVFIKEEGAESEEEDEEGGDVEEEDGKHHVEFDNSRRDSFLPKSFFSGQRGLTSFEVNMLKEAIRNKDVSKFDTYHSEAASKRMRLAYDRAESHLKAVGKTCLSLSKDCFVQPLPWTESTRLVAFGPSGVGKSTFVAKYGKEYKRKYPHHNIILISPVEEDPALSELDPKHLDVDEDILEEPLDVKEFPDSLLIFDDVESFRDVRIKKAVLHFRDICLESGRHQNTSVFTVLHVMFNHADTRRVLNEAEATVFFPKHGNWAPIHRFLYHTCGCGKDDRQYVKDVESRWVMIKRGNPMVALSEHEIRLIEPCGQAT